MSDGESERGDLTPNANASGEPGATGQQPSTSGENIPIMQTGQPNQETVLRNKRRCLKGRMTRGVNRLREAIRGEQTVKRLQKQMEEIRCDYDKVLDCHSELYQLVDDNQVEQLDQWESDTVNALYAIEEELDNYIQSSGQAVSLPGPRSAASGTSGESRHQTINPTVTVVTATEHQTTPGGMVTRSMANRRPVGATVDDIGEIQVLSENGQSDEHVYSEQSVSQNSSNSVTASPQSNKQTLSVVFDCWIDKLIEFQETHLSANIKNMSIADALYRLEASRDLPSIEIPKFDGNPLKYVEFIETFRVQVHEKPHLIDDVRMAQLRSHVKGNAERAISGLGSGGKMYGTALKLIKEQFGHRSYIGRAFINKLVNGPNISVNDKQGLRELSLDVINALATFTRLNYFSDLNASETLRQIIRRLPSHLIHKWKSHVTSIRDKGDQPTITHVSDFLRKMVQVEYDPDFGDLDKGPKSDYNRKPKGVHTTQATQPRKPLECFICREPHRVPHCPTFTGSSVDDRVQMVKDNRLCFSCLTKGHQTRECKVKKKCDISGCSRVHHPLLHSEPQSVSGTTATFDKDSIMPVVRVMFRSANGRTLPGNVLVDSGAGTSIIRREFAKQLGLQGKREGLSLAVVGGETFQQPQSRRVKCWISPVHGGEEHEIEAHEIEQTTMNVPPLDRDWLKSFHHLSDLDFNHKAGPVDLILGVQYSHLHAERQVRHGLPFEPLARRSLLGWYVMGPCNKKKSLPYSVSLIKKIDLQTFYDFETLGIQAPNCECPKSTLSRDDKAAMEMMATSCHRVNNRFIIGLPFKKDPKEFPNNYPLAKKRLESLERSLMKNPAKAEMYSAAMQQYEEKGWSCPVTPSEIDNTKPVNYLPHHGVYRPDKPSTPLRVVFDPASPYQGTCLNSFLHKGPGLNGNLFGVLLRFREEAVAFTGDISKMFLQIRLPEPDTHLHRYLWRDLDVDKEPTIYRLLRVTFGDKSSPDMAGFVMKKIADESSDLPDASLIILRDRYVDDLIHSCPSPQTAVERIRQIESALATGSFQIKEWFTSSPEVRQQLRDGAHLTPTEVNLDHQDGIKTLGIDWNPDRDTLKFVVRPANVSKYTKRQILSKMSMLYDPLGLASCITIKARVAMQDIWKANQFGWDDLLPPETCAVWSTLLAEIEQLKSVEFPRCLKPQNALGKSTMHVFCDASSSAYGSVAYLMWPTPYGPEINIISAKARVAPLRQTTIPRLELMAAVVASRLAKTIQDELKEKPDSVTFWTDSQIVIQWLRSESTNMKIFVGVRVAEIQSTWDTSFWRHVPTDLNPADDLSRGLRVDQMNGRWMYGPSFLKDNPELWPAEPVTPKTDLEFKTPKPVSVITEPKPLIDCERFSDWQRLLRVTAYCMRFIANLRSPVKVLSESLDLTEIKKASEYWIKTAQSSLHDATKRFQDLNPFVVDGILRVGGRLKRSNLSYDQVHPVLLPADHQISHLIMKDFHEKTYHVGSERTLCDSRREFWILKGRNIAKRITKQCVICRKLRGQPHTTLMADLPPDRVLPFEPPFTVTGIDLFGPFLLKYGRNKSIKAWGSIFTCATTRAIHLEIVDGLSTDAFLQALRRFVGQHGWPKTVITDNGTSFVGARKELLALVIEGKKHLQDFAMLHQLTWKFITPLSPHQGGFYERMIKQVKIALQVTIGNQILTWGEMATVFSEVKTLINSRPIGFSPNSPNDLSPLTPNHFILGRASAAAPQGPYEETKNLRKRFLFVQNLVQRFWNRFIKEYVPTLMKRSKWTQSSRQIQVGDIVLLTDINMPRGKWNLARVEEVYPGNDGIIRNVKVKTQHGEYKRSVQRLCPIMESDDIP